MEQLVADWGYPLILLLTFLEGETVVIIGGFAVHRDWLSPEGVIAAGFLGSFLGDQLYYALGRRYGPRLLYRFPSWQPTAARAFTLLRRYDVWFILSFRFIYGVRIVSPFVIGMSKVPGPRFLVLNAISALVWAAAFTAIGYIFANTLELLLGNLRRVEEAVFGLLIAAAAVGFLLHFVRRRRLPKS